MIAQQLEENIQFAFKDAFARGLQFVTVEHLLWVLLDSRDTSILLDEIKADRAGLRQDLENFLAVRVPRLTGQQKSESRPTPGFQRVIRRAMTRVKDSGQASVTGPDVLIAIYSEPDSFGAYYLTCHGAPRSKVATWLVRRSESRQLPVAPLADSESAPGFCRELVTAASNGEFEEPFYRQGVIEPVLRVLCRKYKNNPLLVGEPGVGKSAIVRSLAFMACGGRLPGALKDLSIHEVNVSSLVAGTRFRGDFEARIKKLIAALAKQPCVLLFIDEIHTIIGAGAVSGGTLDAANILKPALLEGRLRCIGATTAVEYARVFAKDHALARRFHKITVPEPGFDEAEKIIAPFIPRLAAHHNVIYAKAAAADAIRIAVRFVSTRRLPDKAIDLLDDTGAAAALAGGKTKVDAKALLASANLMSGLPAGAIHRDEREALRDLDRTLAASVFGQPQAVEALSQAMRRARLGVRAPNRPMGAFLLAGPTGVGKTALAKALAEALGIKLLRFDMAEYMERHAVSRLIGAPPGYVGFEQAGLLTEQVAHHQHCVLLLDEIEKAHLDVLNILLQVMDYGTLTDNAGTQVDFSNVALIMTTNAGAESWEKTPLGFAALEPAGSVAEAVHKLLSPEFRNRLDAIINLGPLPREVAAAIVSKELKLTADRFAAEHGQSLSFGAELLDLLLAKGFSASMGARPLQRAIDAYVIDALVAKQLHAKALPKGSSLHINADKAGRIRISSRRGRAKRPKPIKSDAELKTAS